jgi:hypothetical protein
MAVLSNLDSGLTICPPVLKCNKAAGSEKLQYGHESSELLRHHAMFSVHRVAPCLSII